MKTETQKPEEQINTFEVKSDEEKLREIIKKYSRQTKIYPPMEWWEFVGQD
ncbi:MAG: hypothetical protein PHP53_23550 [Prolixibacteraceae bacterium]|nr:hypothetical protein [Prolixibacteraceae bacterium]